MKYFETVYKKQNQTIEIDAPIVLQETAIIKDTVDNLIQLRNVFFNVGDQKIIAIAIKISQSDVFGEVLSEPFEYVYEDIQFNARESFGNKVAIDLHAKARKAKVDILKAVLEDGTVWVSNPENVIEIQPQREIEASDDFIESIDTNIPRPIFYYVENDSCWQCTCGEPNKISSVTCRKCHRNREVVKELFNSESIHNLFLNYVEKIVQEKTTSAEEDNDSVLNVEKTEGSTSNVKGYQEKNTRDRKKLFLIMAAVVLVLIFVCTRFLSNNHNESTAVNDGELINGNVDQNTEITSNSDNSDDDLISETSNDEPVSEASNDDLISKTKESLDLYISMIGVDATGNSLDVSQEFLDGLDKVFVMGKYGTVSHASTEGSGDTITTMDWISNEPADRKELEEFVDLLNTLFEGNAKIGHYSNISDGDVFAWEITKDNFWPICFLKGDKIDIRWYDRSAVNIPGAVNPGAINTPEESKEVSPESKNTSSNSSQKTIDSDYSSRSFSGSIKRQKPKSNGESSSSSGNNSFQNDTSISYDATLQYGSGAVVVFSSRDSMDRFTSAMLNDNQGTIDEMIASGEVGYVDKGTKCNIVEQHVTWGEVKILEGAYSGRTVCVASEAIQKK